MQTVIIAVGGSRICVILFFYVIVEAVAAVAFDMSVRALTPLLAAALWTAGNTP